MEQGPDELSEQSDEARRESESGYQDGGTADTETPESHDDTAVNRPASDS